MFRRCLDTVRDIARNKWEINRSGDRDLWNQYQEIKASDEFAAVKESFGFDTVESHDHVYLISREDGFFSKTRAERRYDAGVQYNEELFMLDFATLVLLSLLLSGEEETLMVRQFVTLEGFMEAMNNKCREIESRKDSAEFDELYGLNTLRCAQQWNSKTEGTITDNAGKITRYAVLQKTIVRLKKELLVVDIGHQRIQGTKRLEETAKYMLRKERAAEIMEYINEEG